MCPRCVEGLIAGIVGAVHAIHRGNLAAPDSELANTAEVPIRAWTTTSIACSARTVVSSLLACIRN